MNCGLTVSKVQVDVGFNLAEQIYPLLLPMHFRPMQATDTSYSSTPFRLARKCNHTQQADW